jgi:hypothetical protein
VLKIAPAFSAKFFFEEDLLAGLPQKFEGFYSLFFPLFFPFFFYFSQFWHFCNNTRVNFLLTIKVVLLM